MSIVNPGITFATPAGSLSFDGGSYYSIDTAMTALPTADTPYTIEAFIRTTTTGIMGICGWGDYGTGGAVNAFRTNGSDLINYWWANDLYSTGVNVIDGAWHHVVAQFDGTYRRIYVDAVMVAQDTPGAHGVTNVSDFTVGYSGMGSGEFAGLISNLRIVSGLAVYSGTSNDSANFQVPQRSLTATQDASSNISAITAGQCALLLATPNGVNALADTSGNGYTLTAHGSPTFSTVGPFNGAGVGIQENGGRGIILGQTISFTITSARLSGPNAFGATFSGVTTGGFTIDDPNIGNSLYPAYYATITDSDSDIIAAFTSAGELYTQVYPAYIWTVAWGPGSTYTNLAQVGYDSGSKSIYMIPVDPASPWATPGYGGYSLAGTFTFPATFTAYLPPISKNGWC